MKKYQLVLKNWIKIISSVLIRKEAPIIIILLIATFFIFFRTTHTDLGGDATHYSTRAIGLVDYMFAEQQSTPLQWYAQPPWWTKLSWHDHPILLFLIQNIFLKIQVSAFFAKLPYSVMALGTIMVVYALAKRLFGQPVAVLSAALLMLNAHFIALARTALMESGVLFFIALTLYYFSKFIDNQKYWPIFGVALGLMLEAKFTTFFIIPSILLFCALCRREILFNRKFYFAGLIALIIFSPVIIYNVMMYIERGHFALQLARLFNQASPWSLAGPSLAWWKSIPSIIQSLGRAISWPYIGLLIWALISLARKPPPQNFNDLATDFCSRISNNSRRAGWHP